MNLICKLLGHKWRDTSYWEFKRENEKKFRRKITQKSCYRCDETSVKETGYWEVDKTIFLLEEGDIIWRGDKKGAIDVIGKTN